MNCTTSDSELFFPQNVEDREAAKGICEGCAFRFECARRAIAQRSTGVFGGHNMIRGKITNRLPKER